ncbi:restriction endonuclease subunit S [Rhodobacter xanthinilyticus]|uniref:Restriction endonuclease subunit S n=2 Tax=Rhodobacter xanthinilyticus TaxID=1850250 RepID=A0A1D9MGY3_9RHOB|nr:restriction endonuclease subunit S [Rhodobacter xanthinilyticus]
MGHGIVADLWTTRYDEMRAIIMALPSPEEQRAIAAFLDEKCAKVDEAVRIKEEQIALLRERRQILIQQAVTRGLNPAAPMKDSGIDWIGQIPEHWEVRRSKYVFTQRKELARKDDVQLSATQSYGVIPQDEFEELVGRRVVKIQTNLEKRKHVELDDFVISMRSFQGGLERAFATGCIRSSYVILQPLQPVNADFFGYLFKSPRYIKALQVTGSFIRDGQDLNFDNFSKVDLFLPPLNEQAEIAAHIRAGCERIDNGIAIKEDQIAALKEYKTSLINAAVTGKIKVA